MAIDLILPRHLYFSPWWESQDASVYRHPTTGRFQIYCNFSHTVIALADTDEEVTSLLEDERKDRGSGFHRCSNVMAVNSDATLFARDLIGEAVSVVVPFDDFDKPRSVKIVDGSDVTVTEIERLQFERIVNFFFTDTEDFMHLYSAAAAIQIGERTIASMTLKRSGGKIVHLEIERSMPIWRG